MTDQTSALKAVGIPNPPFAFSKTHLDKIEDICKKYPSDRRQSALLPVLWLTQRANGGWLSQNALRAVSEVLDVPLMRVYEVASFYTMFKMKPVGKYCIQICRTTSCWLRGSDRLLALCRQLFKAEPEELVEDGLFSFEEVECLGACANAPVVQINDDYFEDLTPELLQKTIQQLRQGDEPKAGSQIGRQASKPHVPQLSKNDEDVL